MKSRTARLRGILGGSISLLISGIPAAADYVWLGTITGEVDLGKRYTIHNADSASLFVENNWEDAANPGNPAPPNSINTSGQVPAGIDGPITISNGGVAGGTNGAGGSAAHLRTNGHPLTVTGPGSGIKMSVDPGGRAMIQNDGSPGGERSTLTIANGAFVLTQQLQDIEVAISGAGSRLFIGSNSPDHAGIENSSIAITGVDETAPEVHFINNSIENVLASIASITVNGAPIVTGSDPFRIEAGDNVVFTPRTDYSFANFKQLDGQQGSSTNGVSMRVITPRSPTFWDIDGAIEGAGGDFPDGAWDLTTPNWTTAIDGNIAGTTWVDGNIASFVAGSDALEASVTVSGTRTVSGLIIESSGVTLEKGSLAFTGGEITLGLAGVLNLESPVTGNPSVHLEKPTFLLLDFNQSFGAISGYGVLNTSPETTLTLSPSGISSFSGSLEVSGKLIKSGSGELRLNRPQGFSGELVIQSGKMTLAKDQGNIANLSGATAIHVAAGATWDITGHPVAINSLQTLSGSGTILAADRISWTQPAGNNYAAQVPASVASGLTLEGILEPGEESATGEISITSDTVTLSPSGLLLMDLDDSAVTKNDSIVIDGNLVIMAGAEIEFKSSAAPTGDVYELVRYTGTLQGTLTPIDLPAGYELQHAYKMDTIALVKEGAVSGFDAWAIANSIPGAAFTGDGPDGDGIVNGVEYALGFDPRTLSRIPPPILSSGNLIWTLPKGAAAAADSAIGYFFETSIDLSKWTRVSPTAQDATSFSYTLPGGDPAKFLRIVIVPEP